jgi:hypothetical protein
MSSGRSDDVYVALGDSISIDTYAGGPGRGGASLLARNRDDDFPQWRGHDLATRHPSLRYQLLAVTAAPHRPFSTHSFPGSRPPVSPRPW